MKNALSIHNIHVCRFGCLALKTVYLSTKNTFRLEKKKLIDNALIYRPLKREQKKTQLLPIYLNLNQSEVLKTAQFWFSLLIDLSLHDIPFCMAWSARQGIFAIRSLYKNRLGYVTTISDQKCTVGRGNVRGGVPMARCG